MSRAYRGIPQRLTSAVAPLLVTLFAALASAQLAFLDLVRLPVWVSPIVLSGSALVFYVLQAVRVRRAAREPFDVELSAETFDVADPQLRVLLTQLATEQREFDRVLDGRM